MTGVHKRWRASLASNMCPCFGARSFSPTGTQPLTMPSKRVLNICLGTHTLLSAHTIPFTVLIFLKCSFNEPDIASQASMSPAQAAAFYKQYMNPYASRASLGAPAVTNSGNAGQGLDWLQQFLNACGGSCEIDFFPVHWYDSTGNVAYFKKHMLAAREVAGGKPVWLTEFAMNDASQEAQANFIKQVVPWLDAQDWVARYAYFGVFENMMIMEGQLSQSGNAYISA
jgi:hypothetical protein